MKTDDDLACRFDVVPVQPASPLVFAVAHAGRDLMDIDRDQLQADDATIRSLEDPLVDQLVVGDCRLDAALLINRAARAVVDVNRDPVEIDPRLIEGGSGRETPRTRAGLGVVPRLGGDGKALYRGRLAAAEIQERITKLHLPYHAALAELMRGAHSAFGYAVLVDWHSMPSAAAKAEQARGGVRPHIVIGDRFGRSAAPQVSGVVRAAFEGAGRRVLMNRPFAGGYTTQTWGRPDEGFHAIQIEIDRSLYLDETTVQPGPGFAALVRDISSVARALHGALESKKAAPESAA